MKIPLIQDIKALANSCNKDAAFIIKKELGREPTQEEINIGEKCIKHGISKAATFIAAHLGI